jgi:hypothetical protein
MYILLAASTAYTPVLRQIFKEYFSDTVDQLERLFNVASVI